MLIQKIHSNGTAEVFQAQSSYFHWAFESRRPALPDDQNYFPFSLAEDCMVSRRAPGPETRIELKGGEIIFTRDYAMPPGTVIGILFPPHYMPGDITFRQKAFIPVGEDKPLALKPPGQLQVMGNESEKRCALIFHIHKSSCFGFRCVCRPVSKPDFMKGLQVLKKEISTQKLVEDVWLQNQDVMRLLKITDRTLMRRRQDGTIPYSGTRGNYLYKKADIEGMLAGRR